MVRTTTDFTIADVLAWARTKPSGERYDFCNSSRCALAQFGIATDRAHLVGPSGTTVALAWSDLCDALSGADGDDAAACLTFGALLKRLEALCPETPKTVWLTVDAYMNESVSV